MTFFITLKTSAHKIVGNTALLEYLVFHDLTYIVMVFIKNVKFILLLLSTLFLVQGKTFDLGTTYVSKAVIETRKIVIIRLFLVSIKSLSTSLSKTKGRPKTK